MQLGGKTSFHESSITGFHTSRESLTLDLEDVLFEGEKRKANITLEGVRDLTRDGQLIDSVQMEAEDGEVLTLTLCPDRLHLIAEWNDFKSHTRQIRSYVCTCDTLRVDFH